MNALEGIKIVELTTAAAGPTCTKLLIEYGADCIMVEPKGGMVTRFTPQFDFMNTHKKAIVVDLKSPDGMVVMHRLLEDADVFVSNYRYKALTKLKLDYDSIKDKYPRLVYAFLTGYGEHGDMADDPGFDNTAFWCRAGLLHDMTEKGCAPPMPPVSPSGLGDILCGATLALGVTTALHERNKTGKGTKVCTSLLSLGLYANFSQMILNQYGTEYPKTRLKPNRALSNSYPAKDGYIYLITLDFKKDFFKLLKALGREDLVDDPRWTCMKDTEGEKALELREILDEAFSKYTIAELREIFKSIDMALGEYRGCADEINDPQAIANDYLLKMTNYDGKEITVPASPLKFGYEKPVQVDTAAPIGYDTISILKKVGYADTEIEALINNQAVFAEGR